jgi:hypothetical protein
VRRAKARVTCCTADLHLQRIAFAENSAELPPDADALMSEVTKVLQRPENLHDVLGAHGASPTRLLTIGATAKAFGRNAWRWQAEQGLLPRRQANSLVIPAGDVRHGGGNVVPEFEIDDLDLRVHRHHRGRDVFGVHHDGMRDLTLEQGERGRWSDLVADALE